MATFQKKLQKAIDSFDKDPRDLYDDLAKRLKNHQNNVDPLQIKKKVALEFQQHIKLSNLRSYKNKIIYAQIKLFKFNFIIKAIFNLLHFFPNLQQLLLRFILMKRDLIPCKNKFESKLTLKLEKKIIKEYRTAIFRRQSEQQKNELKLIWNRLLTKRNSEKLSMESLMLEPSKNTETFINDKIFKHHMENYKKIRVTFYNFIHKPYTLNFYGLIHPIKFKNSKYDFQTLQLLKLFSNISDQAHLKKIFNLYFKSQSPKDPYKNIDQFSEELIRSLMFIQNESAEALKINEKRKDGLIKNFKNEINTWSRSKLSKRQLTQDLQQKEYIRYTVIQRKNDYINREIRRKKKQLIHIANFFFTIFTSIGIAIVSMFELFIFGTNPLLIPFLGFAIFYTSSYLFGPVLNDIFQRLFVKKKVTYGFNSKLGKLFCLATLAISASMAVTVSMIGAGFLFAIPIFPASLTFGITLIITATSIVSYTGLMYHSMITFCRKACDKFIAAKNAVFTKGSVFHTIKAMIQDTWTPQKIVNPINFMLENEITSQLFHHRCKLVSTIVLHGIFFLTFSAMFTFAMIATLGTYQMELAALMRTFLGLSLSISEIVSKSLIYTAPLISIGIFNWNSFNQFAGHASHGIGKLIGPFIAHTIEFVKHPLKKSKFLCLNGMQLIEDSVQFFKEMKTSPNKKLFPLLRIAKRIIIDLPIITFAAACQAILAIGGGISIADKFKLPLKLSKSLSLLSENFSSFTCDTANAFKRYQKHTPQITLSFPKEKKSKAIHRPVKKSKNIFKKNYSSKTHSFFLSSKRTHFQPYIKPAPHLSKGKKPYHIQQRIF